MGGLCGYPHNPPPEPIEAFDLGSREGSIREIAAVDHLCKGEKFILFSNGLYSTIGKPPGEQVKERYQMNLIIAICGFPIRREISFRILGVSGKSKCRAIAGKKAVFSFV